ncbi:MULTISPECIES: indole-3-glycerol-phosphate synthase [unclassified Archaeoglobus]|jgi:indole-3-glycerol phosphate synthase|uniref:indole-3-glycerol-phosphate synthase n=2 Tax=Archaeoglobus TaxID=2233 RepID=UPI0025C40A43|nr:MULTISPECIES: indole-3-glycerol-phosphate synthase TrpC [unclassified Archaeoglobus]
MYFGFVESLKGVSRESKNAIIAEIKPYSPIHGDLLKGRRVEDILNAYERAGAAAISYITAKEFKGDFETLRKITELTELPVLRKDFIRDILEVERSADAGVSALLLIARHLKDKTAEFVDSCFEHGIEPIVEVHRPEDLVYVKNARVVLINNRDIDQMEKDGGNTSVTAGIAGKIEGYKISGSGIATVEDLTFVLKYVDAALIGTAFMMAEDTESFVRAFVEARG